jgi:hypothetical protein
VTSAGRIAGIQEPFHAVVRHAELASDRHVWFLHLCRLLTTCIYDSVLKEPSRGSGKWVEELFARVNNKNVAFDFDTQGNALEKALSAVCGAMVRIQMPKRIIYDDFICATRVLYGHFMENPAQMKKKTVLKRLGDLASRVLNDFYEKKLPDDCKSQLQASSKKSSIGPRVEAFRKIFQTVGDTVISAHSPEKVKAFRPRKFDDTRYYAFDEEGKVDGAAACFKSQKIPSAEECMNTNLDDEDDV